MEDTSPTRPFASNYSDGGSLTWENSFDIWDVSTGKLHSTIHNPSSLVNKLSFSLDGTLLGCACEDGTVRLWDLTTPQSSTITGLKSFDSVIRNIQVFSPEYVKVYYNSRLSLWNLETRALHKRARETPLPSRFNVDSIYFTTFTPQEIKIWSARTGKVVTRLKHCYPVVPTSTFSEDRGLLALGFGEKSHIIDEFDRLLNGFSDGELEITDEGSANSEHNGAMEGSVIEGDDESYSERDETSPLDDDKLPYSVSEADSGYKASMERSTFEEDDESSSELDVSSPDDDDEMSHSGSESNFDDEGIWPVACSKLDPQVQIWDLNTGEALQIIKGDFQFVNAVSLSADGGFVAFIVAHSLPGEARRWELHVWSIMKDEQINILKSLEDRVPIHLLWSPDSQTLVVVFKSDTIRLYEAMTGRLLMTLSTECFFYEIAFSPDSRFLASCDRHAVRLWDLRTGQIIGKKPFDQPLNLRFSPDGKALSMSAGRIDVRSFYPGQESLRDYDFLIEDDWVMLGGRRVLWLPPEYIPTCVASTNGTLVMAHASGKIIFLKFRSQESDLDVEI
ncbi:uncharacterized protein N7483_007920 [Penicillium malachiteum]|uniref:uncharacterized protein n=1 Tax=Penicillium malachiteum TaxID=1324776 RepID=UPI002546707A|nr:uncharacterized protein N7483_007920 [Penicillium malachiteum]KAJ5726563.1 hypothetical protein N7483_007920 [Penicillium malachiteum]